MHWTGIFVKSNRIHLSESCKGLSGIRFYLCFGGTHFSMKEVMKGRGVKCSPSNMLCFVFYPLFWRLLIIIGAAAAALQSPLLYLSFSHWISTSLANGMTRENCAVTTIEWTDWDREELWKEPIYWLLLQSGDKKETIHHQVEVTDVGRLLHRCWVINWELAQQNYHVFFGTFHQTWRFVN